MIFVSWFFIFVHNNIIKGTKKNKTKDASHEKNIQNKSCYLFLKYADVVSIRSERL